MTGFYNALAEQLPEPRMLFLNYGLAEPDSAAYSWIRPRDLVNKYHLSLVRRVLSGVDLTGKSVLEIGCGRGGNCDYLSRYTDAERIVGVDLCEPNVHFARRTCEGSRVEFLRGDSQRLPVESHSFDVVLNLESSHCYPDFALFLAEVGRVLRPGGVFAYADCWFLNIFDYDWDARMAALRALPMRLLREEEITREVAQALRNEDGLSQCVLSLENAGNSEFVRRIVQSNEAFRLTLTVRHCFYKIWQFQKEL